MSQKGKRPGRGVGSGPRPRSEPKPQPSATPATRPGGVANDIMNPRTHPTLGLTAGRRATVSHFLCKIVAAVYEKRQSRGCPWLHRAGLSLFCGYVRSVEVACACLGLPPGKPGQVGSDASPGTGGARAEVGMAPADAVAQVTPIEPCRTLGRVSPVRMSPVPTLEEIPPG